jgi:hypothetical protein
MALIDRKWTSEQRKTNILAIANELLAWSKVDELSYERYELLCQPSKWEEQGYNQPVYAQALRQVVGTL